MFKRSSIENTTTWSQEDESVRSKLLSRGATVLSDAELLSLLVSGSGRLSALDVARGLLNKAEGSLARLSQMTPAQVSQSEGVGASRAIMVTAALELGRRREAESVAHKDSISGSEDIMGLFQPLLRDLPHEEVWLLLLTGSRRIIDRVQLSQGGTSNSPIDIKIIARHALERMAAGVVLVHNHPNGNPTPSQHDLDATRRIATGLLMLDIKLLDHVIVGSRECFSFAEQGII